MILFSILDLVDMIVTYAMLENTEADKGSGAADMCNELGWTEGGL